jgi:hypothetical protein
MSDWTGAGTASASSSIADAADVVASLLRDVAAVSTVSSGLLDVADRLSSRLSDRASRSPGLLACLSAAVLADLAVDLAFNRSLGGAGSSGCVSR